MLTSTQKYKRRVLLKEARRFYCHERLVKRRNSNLDAAILFPISKKASSFSQRFSKTSPQTSNDFFVDRRPARSGRDNFNAKNGATSVESPRQTSRR